ncbi:MAG: D-proline reductase (dithiol) proprotein PrdA [Firmicutes bacterium]|nr:D-proline reductase (dithiol) proprotein PrdA [Bacillota bacterium]
MSIDLETAKQHAEDYAVTCCRFEAGSTIEPSMLEDPAIFPDLEDSGLLTIPDNCLKIGQVLGAKLKETVDALVALTPDLVEGYQELKKELPAETPVEPAATVEPELAAVPVKEGQAVRIHIGEGKDINLEIPLVLNTSAVVTNQTKMPAVTQATDIKTTDKVAHALTRKHFQINEVKLGPETKIDGTTLYIREDSVQDAAASEDLVVDLKLDIITPDRYGEYSDTIMDVQPIAAKEEGILGEGITRVLDGVVMVVTGTDENGVQISEFGSSEGEMDRNILFNRPGSPDKGDILIKTKVTIKAGKNMERPGPMAAHRATDVITQEIRDVLKKAPEDLVVKTEVFEHKRRGGSKKVVIVKEIMGQGAMHDNYIMPDEPVGTLGAKANVDLGNVPVVVTPLQILDGCIHALTCIGPASKETSRHYWREPLVLESMKDEELDLAAVILVGSPQVNSEKIYVSRLLGQVVEAMDVDGAIVTTEGFGNNHIDFASHIEEIGKRGIPVVGMTFAGVQGQLVVGNKYMDAIVDMNKSRQGIENEILQNNCITRDDAIRAIYMLKAKMAGETIKPPERKYNPAVKQNNIKLIEQVTGITIEPEPNETSLKMSKKRREIYEKDQIEEQ